MELLVGLTGVAGVVLNGNGQSMRSLGQCQQGRQIRGGFVGTFREQAGAVNSIQQHLQRAGVHAGRSGLARALQILITNIEMGLGRVDGCIRYRRSDCQNRWRMIFICAREINPQIGTRLAGERHA